MRKVLILGCLFTILFSCEKKDDLCDSDTCKTYLKIWKELLISRNHLTEAYFDEHIFPYSSSIDTWNDGRSFRVEYKVKIDWAEAKLNDSFIFWLDPSTIGLFPAINAPRATYLIKDQINKLIDQFAFASSIYDVAQTEHLKFTSQEEAIEVLKTASGADQLNTGQVYFEQPNIHGSPGHPFLKSGATINKQENKCMSCKIDLVSGETEVRQIPCVEIIWWCFQKGTKISMYDGKLLSIEKVKIKDTILSVNTNTFLLEEAFVERIDSAFHTNMIQLIFSDSTINNNTSDHPYFVKGKGWCSYEPSETLKKYKIKVEQLQVGDICLRYHNNSLTEVKLKSVTRTPGEVMTYNISKLSRNKSYFANGILVSNEEN
jgi:hypothetical protein